MAFAYCAVQYEGQLVQQPIPPNIYGAFTPGSNDIRLLELQPDQNANDVVRCSLQYYPLDDPPFYTALSYEWGDPSQCRCIICRR